MLNDHHIAYTFILLVNEITKCLIASILCVQISFS